MIALQDLQAQYVTDMAGNRKSIILPIEQFEELLEDLHDLAVVAERRTETPVSLEEIQQRLATDGIAFNPTKTSKGRRI